MMSGGSLITERLRGLRVRKFARRAGAVVLAVIAIDLAASAVTVAIAAAFLKR
jgi:hypothetical protein